MTNPASQYTEASSGALTPEQSAAYYAEPTPRARRARPATGKPHVLTDELGRRLPSRAGAVEYARDVIDWPRATTAVATAMAIGLRLDDTLVCWPRQEVIAADICAARQAVNISLTILEEHLIVVPLYLWRGNACTGCVYVMNVDGWLDDVIKDRVAVLRRVQYVRGPAVEADLVRTLPAGTELGAKRPQSRKR